MPSKSAKQAKLMRAVAHGWKPSRIKGPSRKVAKEFVAADKKAKGYQYGGVARALRKLKSQDGENKYGTEPLTLKQAMERSGAKGFARKSLTAVREMKKAGWTQTGEGKNVKWYPPQPTIGAPGGLAEAATPARTIQPVAGREFISGAAPPRRVGPPARTAAEIAPGFRPGRVPPALVAYLERARAAAGEPEEPVKAQYGGFARRMRGRGLRGRGQPPGGGGLARAAVQPGGGQTLPMKGIGRAPGAGVPLRGVGRPPGMGRPGAGGARPTGPGAGGDVRAAVMPGRSFMPGGGGAGMPGGAPSSMRGYLQMKRQQMSREGRGQGPRIGMGDQQGALARATQVQTGRPPMSRRQGFPGRGGRGRLGGRGRFR